MSAHENVLLAQLDAIAHEELEPFRSVIELTPGDVLAEPGSEIDKVYFPHSGIISCVVALTGGGVIEAAMIGRDGVFGAAVSLQSKRALNQAVVQIGGMATTFQSRMFADLVNRHDRFRKLLLGYELFHLSEVQQTAACNAVHSVLARTCRWLLRMHDLVGDDIAITQEYLSQMLGVRRTSITEAANVL